MRHGFFQICLLAALAASAQGGIFPSSPFSSNASGTTGAVFLKMPAGARAQALGGSFAAAAEDSEAIFWNPAGLAKLEESGLSEVGFGYSALLEGTNAGFLSLARPISGHGVGALAFEYFRLAPIQGYGVTGDPTEDFAPSDMALSGAYAARVDFGEQSARLGAGLKVIRSKVADASGVSFALDVGAQAVRVTDIGEGPLDLGLAVRNLGPAIKTGSVADPLPFKAQMGAQWHVSPHVSILLDGHMPVDHGPYPSLGFEARHGFGEGLRGALRTGMDFRDGGDLDGLAGFRAGGGLDLRKFRLDYAWVPFGDLGMTHRLSMALRF